MKHQSARSRLVGSVHGGQFIITFKSHTIQFALCFTSAFSLASCTISYSLSGINFAPFSVFFPSTFLLTLINCVSLLYFADRTSISRKQNCCSSIFQPIQDAKFSYKTIRDKRAAKTAIVLKYESRFARTVPAFVSMIGSFRLFLFSPLNDACEVNRISLVCRIIFSNASLLFCFYFLRTVNKRLYYYCAVVINIDSLVFFCRLSFRHSMNYQLFYA